MLTIAQIRTKVNAFPDDKPVEELLGELVLLYKLERGLQEAKEGKDFPSMSSTQNWTNGGS